MENASKALLFAAGILIAIILISVAVYIVSMSQEATKGVGSTMSEMQLMQFNQKFTTYEGVRTGSQIKSLVEAINASNVENEGTDLIVEISGDGIDTAGAPNNNKFTGGTAKKYKVAIEKVDGAVKTITIKGTSSTKETSST